jgi:hypothetical protein
MQNSSQKNHCESEFYYQPQTRFVQQEISNYRNIFKEGQNYRTIVQTTLQIFAAMRGSRTASTHVPPGRKISAKNSDTAH